ncbi:MAG: MFS transporter [Anaerolineales bacterium]|jgi:MFS family permease|nr:MFS transporter [Anaerolineales bacterium]
MVQIHIPPALQHRSFRLLWFGLMVSVAGSQMQVAAIHWHIRELTGEPNPLALGGIGLARILPVIAFSLIGGTVADAYNRKRIMFVTQSVMALTALALAALTFGGQVSIWTIYALTAIQASAIAFDLPARQALIPNLVPARDLPNAFSLTSIAFNTGAILGPALSGFVIAEWGQGYTYLINALSFGAVLLALALLGPVTQQKLKRQTSGLAAMREGIHFIVSHPIILSSMLLDFFATFFSSANTMMPIIARDILKVGERGYGLLSSAQSIGAVTAGLIVSQLREIRRQGPTFLYAVVVFGLATIGFGLSRQFALSMAALILMGAADSVSTIIRNTIRQLQTPDYIRGRMTSINQIFFQGGPQLGEVEAGIAAQLFGVPFAIISGGVGCIVAVALIAHCWPQLARYNGDEPIRAGAAAD